MAKEPDVKVFDHPDKEIDTLRTVVMAFESVQPDTRGRMLRFLKDKYARDWPSSDY